MSKDLKTVQAFPYSGVGDDVNFSKGMTLRDYFAGCVLQGLFANGYDPRMTIGEVASDCYGTADAMLKERAKP